MYDIEACVGGNSNSNSNNSDNSGSDSDNGNMFLLFGVTFLRDCLSRWDCLVFDETVCTSS